MQGNVIKQTTTYNRDTGSIFLLRLRRLGRHRFIVSVLSMQQPIFRERIYTNITEAHAKFIKVQLKAEARNYARPNKT